MLVFNELYLLVVAVKFDFYVYLHNKAKNKNRFEVIIFNITFVKNCIFVGFNNS